MHTLTTNPAAIDGTIFRQLLGRFATGIVVLTVRHEGSIGGMTVNAFMSGSLDPPLIVASVGRSASLHGPLMQCSQFGMSILARDQEDISRHFARQKVLSDSPEVAFMNGVPVLSSALATFVLHAENRIPCGDHTLIIGLVTQVQLGEQEPLVYFRGGYRSLQQANVPT
ncbi:MAG: flavin reductase family protein [Hyphomicrobiaceae bacterium]|nr:flavin reductase family protein [Hyphomicrobiaceae bacterium]